jgi:16S rRNA (uracil1498-N3)-methyltransferase
MNLNSESHVFALHCNQTAYFINQNDTKNMHSIDDNILVHRIGQVLRLQEGDQFILFDQQHSITCQLKSLSQRSLCFSIIKKSCNIRHQPKITLLLPLLKREALQEALYAAVELGASTVQLVSTQKGQHAWGSSKELERLTRIMHSAAEQSKNFSYPDLIEPKSLASAVENVSKQAHKIFFDPDGCVISSVLTSVSSENIAEIVVLIGPEGDLTQEEKQFIDSHAFTFCKLTPTILRAQQAVVVGLGILRSMFRTNNDQYTS